MKKYNVKNYIRYKENVKSAILNIPVKEFVDYTPKSFRNTPDKGNFSSVTGLSNK